MISFWSNYASVKFPIALIGSKASMKYLWPVIPISILLIHHFCCYFGHFGVDDMWYARIASKWADGQINLFSADHYEYRWALLGFTALMYKLFGISDFTSAIIPLIQTLIICFILYQILKSRFLVAIMGIAFYVTDQWTLFYSDKLMPDSFVTIYGFIALYLLYRSTLTKATQAKTFLGLTSSVFLFMCFLSKGSFILFLPTFLIFLVMDLTKKRNYPFWTSFLFSGMLVLVFYLGYFAVEGNWLARLHAIQNNSYFNTCSYDQLPTQHLIKRISFDLWDALLKSGLLGLIGIGLCSFENFTRFKFWKVALLTLVLSANFMTISWQSYIPLCPEIRHYLFLVPPASILAAVALYDFFNQKSKYPLLIPIVLLFLCIWAKYSNYASFYTLYLPLFAITTLRYFTSAIRSQYFIAAFFPTLLITPFRICQYAHESSKYNHQKAIIKEKVIPMIDSLHHSPIITNHVQKNFIEYYLGFDSQRTHKLYQYDQLPQEIDGEVILFANGYSRYLSGLDYHKLPDFLKVYYEKRDTSGINIIYDQEEILILGIPEGSKLLDQLRRE